MKKKVILLIIMIVALSGCALEEPSQESQVQHTGKCVEYTTVYKLDCGLFVSDNGFCKERKYDECIRWEE